MTLTMQEKGTYLDLTSDGPVGKPTAGKRAKSFLGVHFTCCDVYSRVYPNREWTEYIGYCPRCAKRVNFKIGPGGTDARFFTAG
jgi:hypothetical protein